MRVRLLFLILFAALTVTAQSGRTAPISSDPTGAAVRETEVTLKQMFEETNGYVKTKATEYETKKVPFSEKLLDRAKLEQRQLAAKYAATAAQRKDLAGDDLYYLGMLHWIAENLDGTAENLRKFV